MASPYRRKQDAILGLENSNFPSTSDSLANAVARYRGESEGTRLEQAEESTVSRIESSRDYARSLYEHNQNVDDEHDVSDLDDSDVEDSRQVARRPSKADQLLGIGQSSLRNQKDARTGPGVSSKAQRILGMSKALKVAHSPSPQRQQTLQSISSDTESIAPKALRTLGIQSRPQSRPQSKHRGLPSPQAPPFDAEDFKRLLLANHPAHRVDNSSSTDVSSSLSRESTISWRTETPRSSQEVHFEELRLRHAQSVFSKRSDSLVDPNAVLTEPFSPLSAVEPPWSKSLPEAPNAFCFELPADMPPPPDYDASGSNFVAELPADMPAEIYEMPAVVPDAVELPADFVDSATDKKSEGLGIQHPLVAESSDNLPAKAFPTKAAGKSSLSKISPSHQSITTGTRPRAASHPKQQLGGMYPIPTGPMRDNRRTLAQLKTEVEQAAMRGQNYNIDTSVYDRELHKSRSSEFASPSRSRPTLPVSPASSNASLGKIATQMSDGGRRPRSTSEGHRVVAKSRYSQKVPSGKRTSTRRPTSSIKEEVEQERKGQATSPAIHATRSTETSSDELPESPVTGSIAGPPTINKPRIPPSQERAATSRETSPEGGNKKSKVADPKTLTTITNLRKEGMI